MNTLFAKLGFQLFAREELEPHVAPENAAVVHHQQRMRLDDTLQRKRNASQSSA
jgi:hypothetical protein